MKQAGKQSEAVGSAARPASSENHLLISAFGTAGSSPLVALSKRISDCGCNLAEARVATLGNELSVLALGWLLGGTVGLGTVVFALGIGPLVQITLRWFDPEDRLGRRRRARLEAEGVVGE